MRKLDRSSLAPAWVLLPVLAGCDKVLGLDNLRTGAEVPAVRCGETQVPVRGACLDVGVPEGACGDGFESDSRGGCDALSAADPCGADELTLPGGCSRILDCPPETEWNDRNPSGATTWYVSAQAPDDGRGTRAAPFRRIAQALDALNAVDWDGQLTIFVGAGNYVEDLPRISRSVRLSGKCPAQTKITPRNADRAVLSIGAGASGTELVGLEISGGNAGVSVEGAEHVSLRRDRIVGVEGPGLLIDDEGVAASVEVSTSAIEGARGAGILAYGGETIAITDSVVRNTRAGERGAQDACGVCIRASRIADRQREFDARTSARPTLTLTGSLLEDNAGTSVDVVGAEATILSSVVRATGAAPEEPRVGLSAEERSFGEVPASLTLTQCLVEGFSIEGVRARNAVLALDRSTVRNIRGNAPGYSRCLGNGVRVIWDRPSEGDALKLNNVLIEKTRETGVLLEGARGNVESTIVRDTGSDACTGGFGDGVSAYAHDFAPAAIHLAKSRVERSARAAVAGFDQAGVRIDDSVLVGPLGVAAPRPALDGALCGTSATGPWATCTPDSDPGEPAVLGATRCGLERDTVCWVRRPSIVEPRPFSGEVHEVRYWVHGHDEIAPAVQGGQRIELRGLAKNAAFPVRSARPGLLPPRAGAEVLLAPSQSNVLTGPSDSTDAARDGLLSYGASGATLNTLISLVPRQDPNFEFDLGAAPVVAVGVCTKANGAQDPPAAADCTDSERQLKGFVVKLLDPGLSVGPLYTTGGSVARISATERSDFGSFALFFNVPPGRRRFLVESPAEPMQCDGEYEAGWKTVDVNHGEFELEVAAGMNAVTTVFCSPAE